MSLLSLPNPTKSVTVNFSADKVKESLKLVSKVKDGFKLSNENAILGTFEFLKLETLSAGSTFEVTVEEVDSSKSKINILGRRTVGTINQAHEASKVNRGINDIYESISELLSSDNMAAKAEETAKAITKKKSGFFYIVGQMIKWSFILIVGLLMLVYVFS